MRRFTITDETFQIAKTYLGKKLAEGEFLYAKNAIENAEMPEKLTKVLYNEFEKDEIKRIQTAINVTLSRRRNKKDKPSTMRLEVDIVTGNKVKEIADKLNISVTELLDEAIYSHWGRHI